MTRGTVWIVRDAAGRVLGASGRGAAWALEDAGAALPVASAGRLAHLAAVVRESWELREADGYSVRCEAVLSVDAAAPGEGVAAALERGVADAMLAAGYPRTRGIHEAARAVIAAVARHLAVARAEALDVAAPLWGDVDTARRGG